MQINGDVTKKEYEGRCFRAARRIAGELQPETVLLLGGRNDILPQELRKLRMEVWSLPQTLGQKNGFLPDGMPERYDLVIVEEPACAAGCGVWSDAVLLLNADADGVNLPDWAAALAEQGYYRDFDWHSQNSLDGMEVLFRSAQLEQSALVEGYEQELDALRERLEKAERSRQEYQQLSEHQRSELSGAHAHEEQLESALNEVTGSTCWKLTWPVRYFISKCRVLLRAFPLFTLFAFLRREGISGLVQRARDRRYYAGRFPGQRLHASRLAPVELLVKQAKNQPGGPKISIVVPLYNTPLDFLEELLDSVVNQTYDNWELCLVDAGQELAVGETVRRRARQDKRIRYQKLAGNEGIAGNTNHGFEMAQGEYIALLDHDDILHPCALWYVAQAVAQQGADFVYTDEVTFEGNLENKTVYHFKPDYMLDNLRSNNYICHLSVFQAALLEKAGGGERAEYNGSQDYDLYLRLTEQAKKIVHIPHLLYYWRSSPTSVASNISAKLYCLEAAVKALYAHYERTGVAVDKVSMIPGTPGFYKTDYTILNPGKVSILIPSCDHARDLKTCVESIYEKTTYPNFEVLIIENNSKEERTFHCYDQLKKEHPENLRVLTWEGTGFNYSALNNFGAQYAQGEYLLLLNNDTEVISPRWLEEMVMYAQQKRVGCVGVKLLYPDDTIQHAGIGFGFLTLAAHMHKNFPVSHPGYMGRLMYAQDVYAVTAACLMIRKEVYDQVNGLDESFAVAFNDVDFCVRVRKAGYQNVFTPFAQLYHYESKSRGLDESPEKRKRFVSEVHRFQQRWKKELEQGDPCMNPNFDLEREDFSFKIQPLE